MKRLKKGPELKMPELKVPEVLVDLYWDLRDRHLLPLLALGLVAIVAVPFLLGGGSEKPALKPVTRSIPSPTPAGSQLAVVAAHPGLRDYRKRLDHRRPVDPFEQRYTGPDLTGAALGNGEEESSSSTSTSTSTSTTTTGGSKGGGSSGGAPPKGSLTLYTYAADVKIVRSETKPDGSVVHEKPVVQHRVVSPAPLPSEKETAVVYMGLDKNHLPLFVVSDAVSSIFGEAKCLAGAETCELLEMEPGIPVSFVYGESGKVRFKIVVLKLEPVQLDGF